MSETLVDRIGDTADAERQALVGAVREFARHEVVPRALDLDAGEDDAAQRCWAGVRHLGLDRALPAEDAGGSGLRRADFLAVLEELAVGDAGLALRALLANAALSALSSEAAAAVPEDERWVLVGPMLAGTPGYEPLRARRQGKRLTIDGRLPALPGTFGADGLVAFAADGAPAEAIALAADTPGLSLRRDEAQMGLRVAAAADLLVEGAEVEVGAGTSGSPITSAAAQVLVQAGVAAIARGISRRACELAFQYAESRYQGGVSIIEHGAVKEMLAGMLVRLRATGPAGSDSGAPGGSGEPGELGAALAARVSAADAAVATTTDAVQVFGGIGYMRETGVEKLMRDAKYCQLYPEPSWLACEELVRLERAAPGSAQLA